MLKQLFAWWDSTTYSTALTLFKRGAKLVGTDEQGNRYFEEARASGPDGRKRRWVLYHGVAEASRVTPDWHGWMHHTFDQPPTVAPLRVKPWEKPHAPNLTGTAAAYAPPGAVTGPASRARATGDYQAWVPE
jgi:NADH:ubiquinone oxidoreductase subunit